jgi:hypothetical protein
LLVRGWHELALLNSEAGIVILRLIHVRAVSFLLVELGVLVVTGPISEKRPEQWPRSRLLLHISRDLGLVIIRKRGSRVLRPLLIGEGLLVGSSKHGGSRLGRDRNVSGVNERDSVVTAREKAATRLRHV